MAFNNRIYMKKINLNISKFKLLNVRTKCAHISKVLPKASQNRNRLTIVTVI